MVFKNDYVSIVKILHLFNFKGICNRKYVLGLKCRYIFIHEILTYLMPANSIKGYCPYSSFVGNKAKGRISKRVLEENKACQINFPKNQHFLPPPPPPPPWYAHVRPFALLPTISTLSGCCQLNFLTHLPSPYRSSVTGLEKHLIRFFCVTLITFSFIQTIIWIPFTIKQYVPESKEKKLEWWFSFNFL